MKHPKYGYVSIHRISKAMTDTLHDAINTWQPETSDQLVNLVTDWLRFQSVHHCELTPKVNPVYYMGVRQGVTLVLIDRKHRTRKQVNPKGRVYSIFK